MKKQLKYANKNNIPYVLIVGEDEINTNCFTLKNMKNGEQEKKSIEDMAPLSLTCTPRQVAETTFHFMTESVTVTGETLILDGGMHLGR